MELPLNMFVDPENLNKSSEDYIHPGKSSQNIIFRTILIYYFLDLFEAQNSNKQHFENDIKLKNKLKKWFETYQSDNGENKVGKQ